MCIILWQVLLALGGSFMQFLPRAGKRQSLLNLPADELYFHIRLGEKPVILDGVTGVLTEIQSDPVC